MTRAMVGVIVKRKYLELCGVADKITPFSFQKGKTVYLEEDCDLPTFVAAAKEKGYTLTFVDKHTEKPAACRYFARYKFS